MNRFLPAFILATTILCNTNVFTQELWHNEYAHIFQGTNNFNPSASLITIQTAERHGDQITVLANVWTGNINVDPESSDEGLFDTADEPNASRRLALIRYDDSGTFLWRKFISSANTNADNGPVGMAGQDDGVMSTAPNGTIHVLSTFYGQVDVSTDGSGSFINSVPFGPEELMSTSLYTARYSQNGDLLGSNVIASRNAPTGNIRARAIAASNDGSSYALISYDSEILVHTPDGDISFSSRPEAPTLWEIVLVKLNAAGEVEWTIHYAGDTTGIPLNGLATDDQSNVTMAGRWAGTLDLNPDNPGNLTMETANNGQWGVFWSRFSPDGTWLAGDAYTRAGPIVNLRDFHLAPNGTTNIVLNNVAFNVLSSGQEVAAPTGSFDTRFVQYSPDGDLVMIRDHMPNGNVFSDNDGNPGIIMTWPASLNGEPVDFNEGAGEPVEFNDLSGTYRFMLRYDSDLNLNSVAALNLLPGTSSPPGFPILLNDGALMIFMRHTVGDVFAPGLSSDDSYTFTDVGFVLGGYDALLTSVQNVDQSTATPQLYPNPSRGEITLNLAYPNEPAHAQLTDIQGRFLLNLQGDQQTLQQEINRVLAFQPAGLFLLSLTQGNENHVIKVVRGETH